MISVSCHQLQDEIQCAGRQVWGPSFLFTAKQSSSSSSWKCLVSKMWGGINKHSAILPWIGLQEEAGVCLGGEMQ